MGRLRLICWGIVKGIRAKIAPPTANNPSQKLRLQKVIIWAILAAENPQAE